MSETNKNVDLGKKDELIKKESAFVDLLSMEINKKIIGQKHDDSFLHVTDFEIYNKLLKQKITY